MHLEVVHSHNDQQTFILATGEKSFKIFSLFTGEGGSKASMNLVYDHGKRSLDKLTKVYLDMINREALCLYAHNFVERFGVLERPPSENSNLVCRKFCEEECILYAGDIMYLGADSYNIASGTVFRSILVWAINGSMDETVKVMHRLQGHVGVIFDVKFLSNDDIASVSDDRSMRVWRL